MICYYSNYFYYPTRFFSQDILYRYGESSYIFSGTEITMANTMMAEKLLSQFFYYIMEIYKKLEKQFLTNKII